jgi:hypothetical protein
VLILVCYALGGYFLAQNIVEYYDYRNTEIADYKKTGLPGGPDLHSYFQYYGTETLIIGAVLALCTIVIVVRPKINRTAPKAVTLVSVLLLATIPSISFVAYQVPKRSGQQPAVATEVEQIPVNCLIYFDEECSPLSRQYMYEDFFEHFAGISCFDKFEDNFGIHLNPEWGWDHYWYSDNSQHETFQLLQEAIQENGGVFDSVNGWWVWRPHNILLNGKYHWIDFVIFVTGQSMDWMGLSPADWNSMIINNTPDTQIEMHEVSHAFYCQHCSGLFNPCCMNPDYILPTECWCSSCINTINAHREKWGYKQWLYLMTDSGLTTTPIPNAYFEEVRDSNVTISATAIDPHTCDFKQWAFTAPTVQTIMTNPCTFTVLGDTEAQAKNISVYTLNIIANQTEGTTYPTVGTHYIQRGTNVSITAEAATGYQFYTWVVYDPADIIIESVVSLSETSTILSETSITNTVQVIMWGNRNAIAIFGSDPPSSTSGGGGRMPYCQ